MALRAGVSRGIGLALGTVLVVVCLGCEFADDVIEWQVAQAQGDVAAYEYYLRGNTERLYSSDAREALERLCFEQAKREDTTAAYDAYARRFPRSSRTPEAGRLAEQRDYEAVVRLNTEDAYRQFMARRPNGPHQRDAVERIATLWFEQARRTETIQAYEAFLAACPWSRHCAEARQALDRHRKALEDCCAKVAAAMPEALSAKAKVSGKDIVVSTPLLCDPRADMSYYMIRDRAGATPWGQQTWPVDVARMRQLAWTRCVDVLKHMPADTPYPKDTQVIVEVAGGGMVAYAVSVPAQSLVSAKASGAAEPDLSKRLAGSCTVTVDQVARLYWVRAW
jgi:hypothetical protein